MLESNFKQLCQNFSNSTKLINQLWDEIKNAHSHLDRHYHTLEHLANIDKERRELKLSVKDNTIFQFATYYHDIVYDVEAQDNEEQSAILAIERLTQLQLPKCIIEEIHRLILSTKTHTTTQIAHAYFLDADLAILGSSWNEYKEYTMQIRKEYEIYSDEIYDMGRKKVLEDFLNQEYIYQTEYFRDKYEEQAHKNMKMEYISD